MLVLSFKCSLEADIGKQQPKAMRPRSQGSRPAIQRPSPPGKKQCHDRNTPAGHHQRRTATSLTQRFRSATPAASAPARPTHTRISAIRTGLIVGVAALTVLMIFIIQNAHAVDISFLGAHLRLSLAVALLLAAIAGALAMAAAGTARITQLRRIMRRNRRNTQAD